MHSIKVLRLGFPILSASKFKEMREEGGFKEEEFDELISILSELVDRSTKEIELNETQLREFEKVKPNETFGLARTRNAEDFVITSNFSLSYRLMRVIAFAVKAVAEAINKLPAKQEFDAVKQELSTVNKVVKDVVVPLKQTIYNIQGDYYEKDRVLGDVFREIHNSTIIKESLVVNSFNKIREHDEESGKALVEVAKFIEQSGKASAGAFDKFNEELNKPQPEKSRLSDFWSDIVTILPSVATFTAAVSKIIGLVG